MWPVSERFESAMANHNKQMPLLIFDNAVFTARDIDIDAGITFNDYFNLEEDLSIGQALSNELQFSLFNDDRYLNDFEFGKFEAMVGVCIEESTYTTSGTVYLKTRLNHIYEATDTSPYLTRDGVALETPPTGKIANILAREEKVYCFQTNGTVMIYKDNTGERIYITGTNIFDSNTAEWVTGKYISSDGAIIIASNNKYTNNYYPVKANTMYMAEFTKTQSRAFSVALYDKNKHFISRSLLATSSSANGQKDVEFSTTAATAYIRFSCGTNTTGIIISENVPRFMRQRFKQETHYGAQFFIRQIATLNFVHRTRLLYLCVGGTSYLYEFVPLGTFIADRPNVPDVNKIDFHCNDQMVLFDKDMPDDVTLGVDYPAMIRLLFTQMCRYVGVEYFTSYFTNSAAVISKRPEEFDTATMRDVIKWIAEVAGGNAKFNRDGKLRVETWLTDTERTYWENKYKSCNPHWYTTSKVTKLINRSSDGSYNTEQGEGDEVYLIQDNPLLRGV